MTTPAAATAPIKPASVWEDFVDIFYAPGTVFERRRDGRWGLAFLVYTVLSIALLFASRPMLQPMLDAQIVEQAAAIRADVNMPPEQREKMASAITGASDSPWLLAPLMIVLPLAVLIGGLVLWMISKLFGSVQSLGQSMMIATYSNFPRLIIGLLTLGAFLALGTSGVGDPYQQGLSPARFLPADSSVYLKAMVSRFELGAIWVTVLMGIGTYKVGNVSKGSAIGVAIIMWVLATLAVIGSAVRQAP